VRRPAGSPLGVVYSSCEEIDAWLARTWVPRRQQPHEDGTVERLFGGTAELIRRSHELQQDKVALLVSVHRSLDTLRQQCEQLKLLTSAVRESQAARRAPGVEGTNSFVE
jgi:hypothetical protein